MLSKESDEDFKKRANFLIPKPSKSDKKNRHKTVGKLGLNSAYTSPKGLQEKSFDDADGGNENENRFLEAQRDYHAAKTGGYQGGATTY